MTRRGALLSAILVLSLAGAARRAFAHWRPSEAPLECPSVVSIVTADNERIACTTDAALARCGPITAGRRYRECADIGPLRGALLRLHDAPVDLAVATEEDLRALPGMGPGLATRILKARDEGLLCDAEDLLTVSGVGSRRLQMLQGLVTSSDERCRTRFRAQPDVPKATR